MIRQVQHKLKIYTKTGDKGKTSLFGGKRVLKSDLRVEAYGVVDELNSIIGVVIAQAQILKLKSQSQNSNLKAELIKVQEDLFEIGAVLADTREEKVQDLEKRTKEIEEFIDKLSEKLPEIKNFILPGGGEIGSFLHLARAVCRRAERKVVELSQKDPSASSGQGEIEQSILIYFNRLSDLFFVMARFVNLKEKKKEIIWTK
ncbi:cob(I)yrinic acid a,c-diamide adenosyltransferase [Candidatus Microgenomates bacterium]|nr:MAG: cob(I)yrinic acid a,c-diamide adenosyltransferase [Candidatus Microgenomates bacterium]